MKAWISSNFGKFATELQPLIDVRIKFLLNILKTNRPIKTKFCIHIIIDKIYKNITIYCTHVVSTVSNQIRFQIVDSAHGIRCSSDNVSALVILRK